MMHHPNMHHQPMSGHPPQHIGGHQGMPGHHQMQPHQLHRENRHVTLTRVPLGPSGGGMGGHGQLGMGAMGVPPPHHAPAQRPPHPIRAMPHHPQQHHSMPPQQMKQIRRGYGVGYGPAGVVPYAHPPLQPPPAPIPITAATPAVAKEPLTPPTAVEQGASAAGAGAGAEPADEPRAAGDEARPPPAPANSKEKTPMCLVNELARYNKIKHQYRLTSETGPAHKKVFTVTLRLGDTEEYTAEGSSIKRAQHSAASAALSATHFPPPPPRAAPAHAPPHPHLRHSVMPTVELNALAMKLCQPAIYTSIPAVAAPVRAARARPAYRVPPFVPNPYQRMLSPGLVYRVRVTVGDRAWLGEGSTPQAARHDAAARALHDLRPADAPPAQPAAAAATAAQTNGDAASDILSSEVKSPVSLVHELALKRNLTVQFTVKSERGPPHMRVFITACTVGEMETEGEGNGKKVSKRRAAERMLDEMRRRWPPALLRARPHERRRPPPAKKKPRNLIKEGVGATAEAGGAGADNPISRLAQARHAARARSPQYRVLEERGAARRREFLVQCDAPPHRATGLGPNKKTAKRRAAHNVLLAMEMNGGAEGAAPGALPDADADAGTPTGADAKRKDGPGPAGDARQPVPGVLLMDYRTPHAPNGVSETGATAASNNSPGAKEQLMYLSQLLGFTVQFSDFPKRNHGEYLSLVSLSTEPPVMCHGGGPSTQHSHEQCARAALRALALMGLDAPAQPANIPAAHALAGGSPKPALGVGAAAAE